MNFANYSDVEQFVKYAISEYDHLKMGMHYLTFGSTRQKPALRRRQERMLRYLHTLNTGDGTITVKLLIRKYTQALLVD